jgi:hypothetical protein
VPLLPALRLLWWHYAFQIRITVISAFKQEQQGLTLCLTSLS